jgi:serine/threonine protein kinase
VVTAPDIPGHRVGGVLGAGGFATVYRCWQLAVGREVAVKVDNRVLFTERDRRRFLREVTAAGRLSGHPHVIDVYDAGTLADGRPYLVMELCPAGSLTDALGRHGPMPAAQVRDSSAGRGHPWERVLLSGGGRTGLGTHHRHNRKVVPTALGT